ncbi:GYDIA family GHMP kinase [Flavivirga spongiicola]|uniref:GYDIA family GHMP kinase n=1 Tax=Flavivirga spongiicola TaxID=421621 RepID=A0ABU7XY64_9FLAO|nr:GYDIA family GHMP kinase [Flavivirga sp. MEBiC05379]MDO5979804.1 GYDIA family GHMP kinase [Flavivirga sp. MEBiC05379]
MKSYYSNGKLLLTGEYTVLDGALSLAVPTKYGQSMQIEIITEPILGWTSLDDNETVWFETTFKITNNEISHGVYLERSRKVRNDNTVSERLIQILNAAKRLNPNFLNTKNGFRITTKLDFPRHWGLGTSSTLINNIAQWAGVDAYKLLEMTFGGSGYDIACAQHNTPITYQLIHGRPFGKPIDFNPPFKDHLYFVYLNKKQNSREGIKHYNANKAHLKTVIEDINNITSQIMTSNSLEDFETLLIQHEEIISKLTKQKAIKTLLFNDFKGSIKSLGAWGGDFILATSKENPSLYFNQKGFETVIRYTDMVL